ncbi:mannose-1-phosphate guanylyltransferase [Propionicicella superfundia]|uniref:mannose-1-phosphate guanylyltransferase n=1 Tax=Propionicicella superfundia TaxID=348582 RepID=UPI0003FC9CBE|nr:mannose-1-phosphate guanylyltransferase [Propionicicella superfundia]
MRYVVIMAGGSGKRLWPLSRQGTPKQLLKLVEGKSLLRIAFERALGVVPAENILVCTGASYADAVAADLHELPPENLLGEPVGRDSLNAVAWPAAVLALRDPDAVIAQLTADHIMHPVSAFQDALRTAFEVAESDPLALVTLGVVPTSPHTGYGYLQRGQELEGFTDANAVVEFKEKPDRLTATQYVESGNYWWNSGMFVWRAQTLLDQVRALLPATYETVVDIAAHPERVGDLYPTLLKTSVDFGIMEPVSRGEATAHVAAVALPIQWYDVGGFASLAEHFAHDDAGNATEGLTIALDSERNLLINKGDAGSLVAVVGLHDTVVVSTPQITLVCPMEDTERIRELVDHVSTQLGPEYA